MKNKNSIINIDIKHDPQKQISSEKMHEMSVAIYDLLDENSFKLYGFNGPYKLILQTSFRHLNFEFLDKDNNLLKSYYLALGPFKKIISDYNNICENYYDAIKTKSASHIQTIDMGRRSMHNEGAELFQKKLEKIIQIDPLTARRIFTLICIVTSKVN